MSEGTDSSDGDSSGGGASSGGASSGGASSGGASSGNSAGVLGTWPRRIGAALVALVGVAALLSLLGVVGVPSAGVADEGDWGAVTDERTEIVTTVWVNNPNPIGVSLGDALTVDYDVYMNDVRVAEGAKSDVDVPPGNSTEEVRTALLNDRLSEWWVAFVRADETVHLDANATLRVHSVGTVEHRVNESRTMLEGETPIRDALSAAVNGTAGEYTRTADAGGIDDERAEGVLGEGASVTVGYEVRRGWATWGSVEDEETTVRFHLLVHNPGDVPVPASPQGLGVNVSMNDVDLFEGGTDEFSLANADSDAVVEPGETREVTAEVRMDNERIDEWFPRHVDDYGGTSAEETAIETRFQLVFEDPTSGATFRVPEDSPAAHNCTLRTAILVDDRDAGTDCDGPGAPVDAPANR